MMSNLLARGEALAREAQRRKVQHVARQLSAMLGGGAIQVEEARVLVRGRGLIRRWLIDPSLRFLSGGFK
jgi:hypothetical protein